MSEWLDWQNLLGLELLGNTVRDYAAAAGLFVSSLLIVRILQWVVLHRLQQWAKKTETTVDDFLIAQVKKTIVPILYFFGLYVSFRYLEVLPAVQRAINGLYVVLMTFFVARFGAALINYIIQTVVRKHDGDDLPETRRGISTLVQIAVWSIGIVFMMDNLGFEIAGVLTGLGIGGIAVALASQAILGDLFSYFIIFFDRPFQVGDFLKIDDKVGTVEHIGIKSTRIRSLGGEELVFSNKDLTNARLHNFKKMERRRVVFVLGVTYQTRGEQLRSLPDLIRSIIQEHADVQFERAHFKEYGNFSLNVEVVYWVLSADYLIYMDIQQSINFRIFEEFAQRGIEFAYPTQTIIVEKS